MDAFSLLLGIAIGAVAIGSLYMRGRSPEGDDSAAEDESSPDAAAAKESFDSRRLYELAGELEPRLEESARPSDVLGDEQFEEAVSLLADAAVPVTSVVEYTGGGNWVVACVAVEALGRRDDAGEVVDDVRRAMAGAYAWPMFFAARYFMHANPARAVGVVFSMVKPWWEENPTMQQTLRSVVRHGLAQTPAAAFGDELAGLNRAALDGIRDLLEQMNLPGIDALKRELHELRQGAVDEAFLRSIGRLRSKPDAESSVLADQRSLRHLNRLIAQFERDPPGSVVITGDPGVGKTAIRRLFCDWLLRRGWRVLEIQAANLIADKSYIGEIEGAIRRLVANATVRGRIALFVDRFHEMASAGAYRGNPQTVLDTMLPSLEQHSVFLVGETSARAWAELLKRRPTLPAVLDVLKVAPASDDETHALLQDFLTRRGGVDEPAAAKLAKEALLLARHYISFRKTPGNAFDLVKLTLERQRVLAGHEEDGAPPPTLTRSALLAALADFTGLPEAVIDDQRRLDIDDIDRRFRQRIIGQAEAVVCLVERIAMIASGLTDAARPFGVFLFAGSTGTGKTEIAKTLAEILFGSADRMVRLDMSEYQSRDSLDKLLGVRGDTLTQSLTDQIRRQPFSVLLLDEFEKAHPAVWDLFLQVFDDGRLTDTFGNVVDFRHCIVIMTSNVGAAVAAQPGIGFTGGAGFDASEVRATIAKQFRKEFVNRIDRIVVFQPFNRAQMRQILHKELGDVLQRRGFRNREWAVEWEDSAVEFLLRKGFRPDLGARPLRRAIDQYVLAPLSMTIVREQFPQGDQFLFVRGDDDGIRVEFVDPDAEVDTSSDVDTRPEDVAGAEGAALSLGHIVLHPAGSAAESKFLGRRCEVLAAAIEGSTWQEHKADLLQRINDSAFWESPERHGTLGRMELMDRIESGWRSLRSLANRLRNSSPTASLCGEVAQKIHLLDHAVVDLREEQPIHVFLGITASEAGAAGDAPAAGAWFDRLCDMYQSWAERRRMKLVVFARKRGAGGGAGEFLAAVSGFGAHSILVREAGLHVWESPIGDRRWSRSALRVTVAPQPEEPAASRDAWAESARVALERAAADGAPIEIVRRYHAEPSPLVRDHHGWRSGRLDRVLEGNFDIMS